MVWDEVRPRSTEWKFKARTYTAQVVHVDTRAGKMKVQPIGTREMFVVDVPVGGLSVRGLRSSWARGMPNETDYVELAFGPRNEPKALRMTTPWLGEDAGGYAQVTKAAEDKAAGLDLIWRELARGEFDLRSSGGAGYYFSQHGQATIFAGATSYVLDKKRSESASEAGLWIHRGDGVEVRFGDVKRLLPGAFSEEAVEDNSSGAAAPKEWSVTIASPAPVPGLPLRVFARTRTGDVRDALGVPELSAGGQPLRHLAELFDASGLVETLRVEVDASGNVAVRQRDLAVPGGIDVEAGSASPMRFQAGTTLDLGGSTGVNLNAGGEADSAIVRGDQLSEYLTSRLSVQTAWGPSGPALVGLASGVELSALAKVK